MGKNKRMSSPADAGSRGLSQLIEARQYGLMESSGGGVAVEVDETLQAHYLEPLVPVMLVP